MRMSHKWAGALMAAMLNLAFVLPAVPAAAGSGASFSTETAATFSLGARGYSAGTIKTGTVFGTAHGWMPVTWQSPLQLAITQGETEILAVPTYVPPGDKASATVLRVSALTHGATGGAWVDPQVVDSTLYVTLYWPHHPSQRVVVDYLTRSYRVIGHAF